MNWYIMIRFKCILQNDETDCDPAAHGLVKVIEHYGFQQKVVEADKSVLTNKLPLPAIAHMIIDDSLLHYVVITKVKDDTVVVFDPAKGIAKGLYVLSIINEVNLTQCILISLLIRMN